VGSKNRVRIRRRNAVAELDAEFREGRFCARSALPLVGIKLAHVRMVGRHGLDHGVVQSIEACRARLVGSPLPRERCSGRFEMLGARQVQLAQHYSRRRSSFHHSPSGFERCSTRTVNVGEPHGSPTCPPSAQQVGRRSFGLPPGEARLRPSANAQSTARRARPDCESTSERSRTPIEQRFSFRRSSSFWVRTFFQLGPLRGMGMSQVGTRSRGFRATGRRRAGATVLGAGHCAAFC
jgi:hypothetical protein